MKTQNTWLKILSLSGIALAGFAFTSCDVDKTADGEMPEVEVKGGKLPDYDVETADVEVGTKKVEMEVPDVKMTMPDEKPDAEE